MAGTPAVPDMRLELVPLPVSDVDRAKAFYEQAGFGNLHDTQVTETMRVVQRGHFSSGQPVTGLSQATGSAAADAQRCRGPGPTPVSPPRDASGGKRRKPCRTLTHLAAESESTELPSTGRWVLRTWPVPLPP